MSSEAATQTSSASIDLGAVMGELSSIRSDLSKWMEGGAKVATAAKPPREKRQIPPEQKAVLIERLARAREVKAAKRGAAARASM